MSGDHTKYDSMDWIEDACDTLDKSRFQWLLITVVADGEMRIDSNLNEDMLISMANKEDNIEDVLAEYAKKHLDES